MRFILVRPADALNIGAAARAMTNFGLKDLVVVDPRPRGWRIAHSSSRYGSKLLANAKRQTLEEALADRDLVLGTDSEDDRTTKRKTVTLPALGKMRGKRIAVLFGSERDGLNNEELSHCHALLRIPTKSNAPSMNLGQAVALIAYEIQRGNLERTIKEPQLPIPNAVLMKALVDTTMNAMKLTRVNSHLPESARRRKVRNGLRRWNLSRPDAAWLRGLLEKLSHR